MPLDEHGVWLVSTSDHTLFRCHVDEVGPRRQKGWVFTRVDGRTYIGPPWEPLAYEHELREFVDDWWESKKSRGEAD